MVEIILAIVIIIQSIFHYVERRDMCNRLMSKNYTEYRQSDSSPPSHISSAHDRVLKRWRDKGGDS
jgi:hypothetical protein